MKIVTPSSRMENAPVDALLHVYLAARRCYSGKAPKDIFLEACKTSIDDKKKLVKACIRSGHESVLEHAIYSFHLCCSRAASHQLVRHRLASYSQESQRYVKMEDLPVIMPDTIKETWARRMVFLTVCKVCELGYRALMKLGAAAEDSRSVTPQATATHIIATMNARQLRHFFQERTCNRAQKEIRGLANGMLDEARDNCPALFDDAGPKCMKLKHCPEAKPCGKQPWKEQA